ncbi:MAG: glycerol-3-phosphate acyltransferase, partial [Chloroflexota bacterium]
MIVKFIFIIIGAYLLGSVPFAYIAARLTRGIDIRKYG